GQLLLALPHPRGTRRGCARGLGANDNVRGNRRDRGSLSRSSPTASPPLQTGYGTGRARPDRARTAGDRRPPERAAGARARHPPTDRLRRRALPTARLPARRRETTGAPRLQHLPRLRPTPPRRPATTAAHTGGTTPIPQRRPRHPSHSAEPDVAAIASLFVDRAT